jgi:hypothetical protein
MPIRPQRVTGMDLVRAREIVRSLAPLKGLSSDDAEFVARTIAQCFAKGREQGLHSAWAGQELQARGALPSFSCPTAQERHSS